MKQLSLIFLLVLFSAPAMAYVGPGLGMGVIGTIFGVVAAIVLALFGLFWYPLKRAFNKRKGNASTQQYSSASTGKQQTAPPDAPSAQFQKTEELHQAEQPDRQVVTPANTSEASMSNRTDSSVR